MTHYKSKYYKEWAVQYYLVEEFTRRSMLKSKLQKFSGLKYENLNENVVKAIDIIPQEYYKNILEGACL